MSGDSREMYFYLLYKSQNLSEVETLLNYYFLDKTLLVEAFVHSTYAYEEKFFTCPNNERLEFLGDGILDFVIADLLFSSQIEADEGLLTKTRALVVCESTLYQVAKKLDIGRFLFLGKGERLTGGKDKPSNLANLMEAIFAAVYLDGGFEKSQKLIVDLMANLVEQAVKGRLIFDYKSQVLEWAQIKNKTHKVEFNILEECGPVHNKIYTAGLYVDGKLKSEGTGASKKLAEQAAAQKFIETIR